MSNRTSGGFMLLLGCWIRFCLAVVVMMPSAVASSSDRAVLHRLLDEIDKIPMVDTHSHVPLPGDDGPASKDPNFHYDVSWLLGSTTYVAEFLYGNNWPDTKKMLEINAHHAYYRPIRQALVDLYGLNADEELSDDNVKAISERMDK